MSRAARSIRSVSSSETVVPFPISGRRQTGTLDIQNQPTVFEGLLRTGTSAADLRREIELAVSQFVQERSWSTQGHDDPYDAVYIADLEMDAISTADILRLKQFSTIRDRSEELQFPDD